MKILITSDWYYPVVNGVVLPAEAGEKHFGFEERVKLVNPRITAEGYKIGTRGFTNYLLHADDMIKE